MPPPLNAFASRRYALVVDAGSSGSRLQIYSWRDPKAERQLVLSSTAPSVKGKGKERERQALRRLPRVEKGVQDGMGEWQKKVEPGISSLAASPITFESVAEYIDPLMAHAINSIPPSQHASTPIYILATAGMRLLPPESSSKLIETTCDVLRKNYPFMVGSSQDPGGPCGETVRIISGEEEGLWGWIAVNYLMDGFGEPTELVPTSISSTLDHQSKIHPYGFLDMGGASTQIAFTPSDSEASAHRESLSTVKLRLLSGEDLDYDVFVASWLGYGTNRARERYVGTLVDKYELDRNGPNASALADGHISDPCLPKHLTLHENPKLSPHTLASLSPEEAHQATLPHVLKGTGSFPQCLLSLQPLLNKELPCPANQPHQCLFDALPTPKIDFDHHRFIGVSEYWYSSEHVFNLGGAWDFEEFEKKASEYCQMNWGDIQSKWINQSSDKPRTGDGEVLDREGRVVETGRWGPEVEIPRLQMQCFKAAWLVNVLHEGIGLPRTIDPHPSASSSSFESTESEASAKAAEKNLGPSKQKKKASVRPAFQSVDTVGDTAISWTLGKMVIEASKGIAPDASFHKASSNGSSYRETWLSFPARLRGMNGLVGGGLESVGSWSYLLYLGVLLGVVGFFLRKFKRRILRPSKKSLAGGLGSSGGRKWRKGLEEGPSSGYTSSSGEDSGPGMGGILTMGSGSRSKSRSGRRPLTIASRVKHLLFHRSNRPPMLKQTRSAPMLMRSSSTPPQAPPPAPPLLPPPFLGPHSAFGRTGPAQSSSSMFYQVSAGNAPSVAHSSVTVSPPSSPRRLYRPSSDLEPGSPDSPRSSIQSTVGYEDESGAVENEGYVSSSGPSFRSAKQHAGGTSSPGGSSTASGPTTGGGPLRRLSSNSNGGISVDFHLTPLREILKKTLPPSSLSTLSAPSSVAGGNGGWNDPPVGLLGVRPRPMSSSSNVSSSGGQTQAQAQEDLRSGVLTPPAGPASLSGSTRNSRNSSRVDLLGLSGSGGLTGRGALREFSRVVNSDGESE